MLIQIVPHNDLSEEVNGAGGEYPDVRTELSAVADPTRDEASRLDEEAHSLAP